MSACYMQDVGDFFWGQNNMECAMFTMAALIFYLREVECYDNERGFQWCNFLPALCVPTKLQGRLFPTVYVLGAGKSFSWSDCCHCGYVILLI